MANQKPDGQLDETLKVGSADPTIKAGNEGQAARRDINGSADMLRRWHRDAVPALPFKMKHGEMQSIH